MCCFICDNRGEGQRRHYFIEASEEEEAAAAAVTRCCWGGRTEKAGGGGEVAVRVCVEMMAVMVVHCGSRGGGYQRGLNVLHCQSPGSQMCFRGQGRWGVEVGWGYGRNLTVCDAISQSSPAAATNWQPPPPLFLPSNHGSPAAFTFSACRAVLKCHSVNVVPTQTVGVHREVSLFRSVCVWRVISCRIIKLRWSEADSSMCFEHRAVINTFSTGYKDIVAVFIIFFLMAVIIL